jgi:prophage regulatory protein
MNDSALAQAADPHQSPLALQRLPQVLAVTGLSSAALYQRISAGLFPRPVKVGPKRSAWPSNEVQAIVRAHIAGRTESEIAELARDLHQRRGGNSQAEAANRAA